MTVIHPHQNRPSTSYNIEIGQPRKWRSRSIDEILKRIVPTPREEGNFSLGFSKLFRTRTRFIMVLLVLLCLTSVWSNIIVFNFAILCLHNDINKTNFENEIINEGKEAQRENFLTSDQQIYLTLVVAIAALIANFSLIAIASRFGIRSLFTILGLLSAVATCMIPTAIDYGYYYIIIIRIFQGLTFASNFIVIGSFASKWTYYKQNGLFVSILVAYVQLSPAVSMPISGALCSSSLGWPSVYYFHGGLSAILFLIFGIFYRNSPDKHPFVSDEEKNKIAVGKTPRTKKETNRVPYKQIFKTSSVWAVWIAAFGNFMCANVMFLYSPTYFNQVLGLEMKNTGLAGAIPPLLQFLIKIFAGFSSDKLRNITETNKLRLYNSVAFFGCAFFLVIIIFLPKSWTNFAVVCIGLAAACLGFTTGGFFKAGPLVSKHYSHFVTGNISLGLMITMLIVPFLVLGLAPSNTAEQWRYIFLSMGGILVFTNIFFCVFCQAEPAPWTADEFTREASNKTVDSAGVTQSLEDINLPSGLP